MNEYSDYLKGEAKKIGHKKPFHIKSKVLVLDEANKKKFKVRSSDFDSLDPIRVFIITSKKENQLTENVTTDTNGFTECYKKTKGSNKLYLTNRKILIFFIDIYYSQTQE